MRRIEWKVFLIDVRELEANLNTIQEEGWTIVNLLCVDYNQVNVVCRKRVRK